LTKEMLFELTIPEEALIKQKKVVAQEYEDKHSRPSVRFWEKEVAQYFGEGHLYTRDGIGKKECFEKVTRQELLNYMKEKIVPANMVMAIAGNFDLIEVEKYLRKVLPEKGEKAVIDFGKVKPSPQKVVHYEPEMTTATIQMGWLTKGMSETTFEGRVVTGLASYLLGGSTRSILFKIIREKLGLAYGASTKTEYYPTVGWFEVNTSVKSENIEKVILEIQKLIRQFVEEPIEKLTFERAKKYLIMQKQMAYESSMGTASSLSSALFWQGKIVSPEEYQEVLKKITEKEVRLALKEIVANKEPLVAIMMSK